MREEDILHLSPEPTLRSGKIRELTGLSDRQMHEWDKRGAFPSQREGSGHRRATAWDAIALKIASALRDRYRIPLRSIARLLNWMLGKMQPAPMTLIHAAGAEHMATTPEEMALARKIRAIVEAEPHGNETIESIIACRKLAETVGSALLTNCLHRVAAGSVPIYAALGHLTLGFPTYLITNLERHVFVSEPWLTTILESDDVWQDPIVMRVDGHINEVLRAFGGRGLEPTRRAREIESVAGSSLEEQERVLLDAIRRRDFDSITISQNKHGYKIEITREYPDTDLEGVAALIESQDYQTVIIKNRAGRIARVQQTTTHLVAGAKNGKTPQRSREERSSRHA